MPLFPRGPARVGLIFMVLATALVAVAAPASATTRAVAPTAPPTTQSCAAAKPGYATCFSIRQTRPKEPSALTRPGNATPAVVPNVTPGGYGPTDLRSAYKLTGAAPAGTVIAIIDAYNNPNAESDLKIYRAQFGLPVCTTANGCFRKVNQNGAASPLPPDDDGWAGEIALDLAMVSAVCPTCSIMLVEAQSAALTNLFKAVDRAVTMGAKFVSNSWGADESSGQGSFESHFNHPGVAITASTGDNGYDFGAQYPPPANTSRPSAARV